MRFRAFVLGIVTLVTLALAPSAFGTPDYTPTSGKTFGATSYWNDKIGSSVTLDSKSSSMVAHLDGGPAGDDQVANISAYGVKLYYADAGTKKYFIQCSKPWGTCDTEKKAVPIPDGATANTGSDARLVVVDLESGDIIELWQYKNDYKNTSWSEIVSDVYNGQGLYGATGAGVSSIAGMVRLSELHAVLNGAEDFGHAMVFSTTYCQPNVYRTPATKTDGKWTGSNPIPEGARVQLDPAATMPSGLDIFDKAVFRTLQRYGAYAVDCGGAEMAFIFEQYHSGARNPNPYDDVGWVDYQNLRDFPWHKLRVLASWDSHSGDDTGTTDTEAPTAPSNLRVTGTTSSSVSLAWDASTDNVGVTKYEVWRGDGNWENWVLAGTVDGGTLTFTNTGLAAGCYTYGIRAFDAAGNKSAGSNSPRVCI